MMRPADEAKLDPVGYHWGVRFVGTVGLVVATAALAFAAGRLAPSRESVPSSQPAADVVDSVSEAPRRGSVSADEHRGERRRSRTRAESPIEARDRARARAHEPMPQTAAPSAAPAEAACDAETVQALEACVEERVELLGRAIPSPPSIAPRFEGRSLGGQIGRALEQAGVAGEVEATDCSEHPCIVFGRLEGDEADIEKVERAEVLQPYEADILTLLFWATTSDDPTSPARETGLFALAYYEDADRQEHGEDLERRIRARVMEYWNTDRPGPTVTPP